MRRLLAFCVFITISFTGIATAADIPTALIFAVTAGDGAMPNHATEATRAVGTYLRQTGKLDAATYDPDSAIVKRALEEQLIKSEDLVGKTTPESRLRIGSILGFDYVVSGELKFGDTMKINLWIAHVRSRKVWGFEGEAPVSSEGKRDRAVSNAIQTATARVVAATSDVALKTVKPAEDTGQPTETDTTAIQPDDVQDPASDAQKHFDAAEAFLKAKDPASAILEYRRAIDADPKNLEARVKLAQLYTDRQMYAQAKDELDRALAINPKNELVVYQMEKLKEAQSGTTGAASATGAKPKPKTAPASTSGIAAGDDYWRKQNFVEAEKQYRMAIAVNDSDVAARERLGLLLAALGRFDAAAAELHVIRELSPEPDTQTVSNRYEMFQGYVTRHIKALLRDSDQYSSDFSEKRMTREEYYQKAQSYSTRVESLIRLNDVLLAPESAASAYRHQSLGLSLLAQSCTHLISYLETNKQADKDSADMMIGEARKHLAGAGK